jgi:quercetin dioxygenase-like cupin family protein
MMDNAFLRELSDHNVVKLAKGEGSASQIANLRLIWKARGPETGYQFSIYEMVLQPGVGIPLHKHPYAEFFTVLEGEMSFARLGENEAVEWIKCNVGDSVTAPANAPTHIP